MRMKIEKVLVISSATQSWRLSGKIAIHKDKFIIPD